MIGTSPGLVNPGLVSDGSRPVPASAPPCPVSARWAGVSPAGLSPPVGQPVPGVSPGVAGVAPPGWSDRVSSRRVW
ncbi:hypothetical protein I553_10491 [Mycobacterium xenopi 4042]|uniref:Uncharacterized protein n=1 Tax=Mycobacterium xenopi 4042 TaxID=1299334 RepID=X8DK46_MYCXE|nr:hypothetical protein I553_10491 [Mycobacterium xenopi 4042]